jgi:phosphoenolpyruvate carboxylase
MLDEINNASTKDASEPYRAEIKKLKDRLNTAQGLLGEALQLVPQFSQFNFEVIGKWKKTVNKYLNQSYPKE